MLFGFAAGGQAVVPTIEALLGAPRMDPRRLWRVDLAPAQLFADEGVVAIVPRRFDEHAPHMGIPGFGDRAARPFRATGMLGGDQTDIRHQPTRRGEPSRVT